MSNKNKILIDEAISDIMSQEQEQLNLGAWANMERMLDGKNPYAKDEEKRKRGGWLFFIGFMIMTLITGGAYYSLNKESKQIAKTQNTNTTKQVINTTQANTTTPINQTKENYALQTEESSTIASNKNVGPSTNNNEVQNNNDKEQKTKAIKKSRIKKQKQNIENEQNTQDIEKNSNENSITNSLKNQSSKDFVSIEKTEESKVVKAIKKDNKKQSNKKTKENKTNKIKEELYNNEEQPSYATIATAQNILPIETKITAITVKQNKHTGKEDTLGKEYITKVSKPALSPEQTNPRLVKLSAQDEQKVNIEAELPQTNYNVANNTLELVTKNNTVQTKNEKFAKTQKNESDKKLKQDKIRFAERIDNLKNSTMAALNFKVPTNFGIYAGVNNNFNINKNDVGGFHFGTSLMMRIKPNLYIIPNMLYSYKFNNALTISDYQISNPIQDSQTTKLIDSRMYNLYHTRYDSTATTWNFGRFQTINMPIMVQYEKGRIGYYAGVNLEYGFKIKNQLQTPTTVSVAKVDTLLATAVHSPRNAQSYAYNSNSFNSRYGFGYTLGVNYYATPNLYLDARLTQNVWTNSQIATTKNISSYFFTSPTVNLAIGYRFKDKELNKRK